MYFIFSNFIKGMFVCTSKYARLFEIFLNTDTEFISIHLYFLFNILGMCMCVIMRCFTQYLYYS